MRKRDFLCLFRQGFFFLGDIWDFSSQIWYSDTCDDKNSSIFFYQFNISHLSRFKCVSNYTKKLSGEFDIEGPPQNGRKSVIFKPKWLTLTFFVGQYSTGMTTKFNVAKWNWRQGFHGQYFQDKFVFERHQEKWHLKCFKPTWLFHRFFCGSSHDRFRTSTKFHAAQWNCRPELNFHFHTKANIFPPWWKLQKKFGVYVNKYLNDPGMMQKKTQSSFNFCGSIVSTFRQLHVSSCRIKCVCLKLIRR